MEFANYIKEWTGEYPLFFHIAKYLIWVAVILVIISFLRRLIKRRLPDSSIKYKSQKGMEFIGYVLIVFMTISYFTGSIKDFALAIGLLTAGITITLQELILSVAGSFYIFVSRIYKPGDRIEINGIRGDVIDISTVNTTMMEIGQWVSSDNYSGRIVKISNAFVFKGPVYNYSQDFPFVWDEMDIPIHYDSDVELAKKIVIESARELLSDFVDESISDWREVVRKYYIENANVEPTLAISITDNWFRFNLRYIVNYKKRRVTRNDLNELISKKILESGGKVKLASQTIEIVKIPAVEMT